VDKDYQFDAFFSYKRDPESDNWHERVKDKLAFWLRQELQRTDVRIFYDREDIRTGTRWHAKLSSALKSSRCIICIWSPLYFQSKWCISEWKSFVVRSELVRRDLILPASYFDGESFPPEARAVQFSDFSNYASTMPRFWDTELAVEFENNLLRPFASDIAAIIRDAPAYDDAFPVIDALDTEVLGEAIISRIGDE
jgi:hypothetical protein